MSDPTPSEQRAETESLGQLLSEIAEDLSGLLRQELALAKAELRASATNAAKGAGMMGGAGYAAGMAFLFLSLALWAALGSLIGGGWAGVVVGVLWAVVALVLFFVGKSQLKNVKGMPQTAETFKEFPPTLKRNEENR